METLKKYGPLILIAVVGYLIIRKIASSSTGNITTNLTTVTPATAAAGQPGTDPLLPYRAEAFSKLSDVAIAQTQADIAKNAQSIQSKALDVQLEQSKIGAGVEQAGIAAQIQQYLANIGNQLTLGLRGYSSAESIAGIQGATAQAQTSAQGDIAKYLATQQAASQAAVNDSYLRQLELYYQQRENDRQAQQAAINQSQSAARTNSIIGSVGTALGGLFGRGGLFGGTVSNQPSIFTPPTFPSVGYSDYPDFGMGDPFNVSGNLLGDGASIFGNGFGGLF